MTTPKGFAASATKLNLMSSFVTLFIAVGGMGIGLASRLAVNEQHIIDTMKLTEIHGKILEEKEARIRSLETAIATLLADSKDSNERLKRIENKLDREK